MPRTRGRSTARQRNFLASLYPKRRIIALSKYHTASRSLSPLQTGDVQDSTYTYNDDGYVIIVQINNTPENLIFAQVTSITYNNEKLLQYDLTNMYDLYDGIGNVLTNVIRVHGHLDLQIHVSEINALSSRPDLFAKAVAYTIKSFLTHVNRNKRFYPHAFVDIESWGKERKYATGRFNIMDRALRANGYVVQNRERGKTNNSYQRFDDWMNTFQPGSIVFGSVLLEYFNEAQENQDRTNRPQYYRVHPSSLRF